MDTKMLMLFEEAALPASLLSDEAVGVDKGHAHVVLVAEKLTTRQPLA